VLHKEDAMRQPGVELRAGESITIGDRLVTIIEVHEGEVVVAIEMIDPPAAAEHAAPRTAVPLVPR